MRRTAFAVLIVLGSIAAWSQKGDSPREWVTAGFEAFNRGTLDSSGANLYVSRSGTLQTIHRTDLNSDGYPDLIFNNTHDIAYMPPAYQYSFRGRTNPGRREFPGAGSVRVRVAELNGDGHPELIVARGFDDTTRVMNSRVYWGAASGWSESRYLELPAPYVQDFCVADFDGDGRQDIAFVASGTAGVNRSSIYSGKPDGFDPLKAAALETPGAQGCAAADLDGDGHTDLVIAGDGVTVYWGGAGPLDAGRTTHAAAPRALGAAIFDGRLAVGTRSGPMLYRVRGRRLEPEQTLALEGAARLAAGDLNGDGTPDLVVARTSFQHQWDISSRIYWGKRSRGDRLYSDTDFTELPTQGAADAAIADLDGDGNPDVVFANSRSYESYDVASYVYWGGPQGYAPARRTEVPTHGAVAVAAQGSSVYFANATQGGPVGKLDTYVYLGTPGGQYSTAHMLRLPTVGGYESCAADFDSDGFNDVLLLGSHEGDHEGPAKSHIFWGSAAGYSAARTSSIPTRGAIGCAVADWNRDGHLDLLFANMDDDTVALFPGKPGRGAYGPEQTLHVKMPRFPAIADLNRDGYLDLLVPSVDDGLWIFWGAPAGYSQRNHTILPGIGTVSEQVADLNHDGYLDVIVCNLLDRPHGRYQGVNTYVYWGSPQGYRTANRMELPASGAHHAVVADFNRDGALDIFISNYQSEFSRDLDSHIYWGSPAGEYSAGRRLALHVGSAAGVVAQDLNGDGWIDLAVSNHVAHGDHHARSPVFFNGPDGFLARPPVWLPAIGPHMMTGVDEGNLYTRLPREAYESAVYDGGRELEPERVSWEGKATSGAYVSFDLRGADSEGDLRKEPWRAVCRKCGNEEPVAAGGRHRRWQYRAVLHSVPGTAPQVRSIKVRFRAAG